jgi:hypothetical protein
MANVFRSKEVYKHLKYDLHDRNEMVPVQGVYISGEYRPPYYNDPCIHIYEISSQNAKVDSFQDIDATSGEDALVKIIDFSVSTSPITITDYTTASTDTGEDSLVKILDFWVQMEQPSLDFYESKNQNAGEDSLSKILDFWVQMIPIQQPIVYQTQRSQSTPEPMLRLSSITSENALIENYT